MTIRENWGAYEIDVSFDEDGPWRFYLRSMADQLLAACTEPPETAHTTVRLILPDDSVLFGDAPRYRWHHTAEVLAEVRYARLRGLSDVCWAAYGKPVVYVGLKGGSGVELEDVEAAEVES